MKTKIAQIGRNNYIGFVNFALAAKLVRKRNWKLKKPEETLFALGFKIIKKEEKCTLT